MEEGSNNGRVPTATHSAASPIIQHEEDSHHCWVCFATEEDDESAAWVKPCKCRGTTKWVHQSCLLRWVDEKQKGNSTVKVNCPQCGMRYVIAFPNMGQLMFFLDKIDTFIFNICPFAAAGILVGGLYWTSVTYGAITVMQLVGYEEGMNLMEKANPLFLLLGLPTIPCVLIIGKMVRWEDKVLRLIRTSVQKVPILKYILPVFRFENEPERISISTTAMISDPWNATRVMCGALSLPTIATVIGRIIFATAPDKLTQAMLGATAFLLVKGIFKVYFKQKLFVMQSQRIIKDFEEITTPREPTEGRNL